MKKIFAPHLNRHVIVGGRRPRAVKGPRLRLCNYLDMSKLPPAPDCDYRSKALGLTDVLMNDTLGDCTCAGVGHIVDVVTGNAGNAAQITAAQVLKLYELACGYNPDNPSTDQGGDELEVLDFVCEKGIDGSGLHKFDASVLVDASDKAEVRAAMFLFGNLYFGVGLPDAWLSPFPSGNGFTWDVAPTDPENGHCFVGVASAASGITIDTWGLEGTITYGAIAACASARGDGELHTILTCDWINAATAKAPSGFALEDLLSDLHAIGAIAA